MFRFFILTCLILVGPMLIHAQSEALGSWNILNVKLNLNDKWSLFLEPQIRSLAFYDDFHYYEVKGGFTTRLSKTFSFTSGIGRYDTYREGGNFITPKANNEIRTWLQLSMNQNLDRIRFEHRYRAEQRWTSNGYRNRFRYRLSTTTPLNKEKVEPGTLFLTVWDEIFLTDRAPYFERNRFFAGLGYEFSPNFSLQSGFINQFDYRLNDETGRNFLQISLLFELDWKKFIHVATPGAVE
jgi:Protein of unknown function (DUF2490)